MLAAIPGETQVNAEPRSCGCTIPIYEDCDEAGPECGANVMVASCGGTMLPRPCIGTRGTCTCPATFVQQSQHTASGKSNVQHCLPNHQLNIASLFGALFHVSITCQAQNPQHGPVNMNNRAGQFVFSSTNNQSNNHQFNICCFHASVS